MAELSTPRRDAGSRAGAAGGPSTPGRDAAVRADPAGANGTWPAAFQASRVSGGRDRWSEPLREAPADETAALTAALGEVLDPELPVSLVDLGLVRGVEFEDGVARIDLTFTATACPCMDFIKEDVRDRIEREPWVRAVEIEEVWDPPWTTASITERGRRELARFGVGA